MQSPFYLVSGNKYRKSQSQLSGYRCDVELATTLIEKMEDGDFNHPIPADKTNSELIQKLEKMRKKLQLINVVEEERRWATEGLAKFIEILRNQKQLTLDELCDNLLEKLVKYVGANQGGIFLVEGVEEQFPYIQMQACYAYSRKKFLNQTFDMGEGLIGQCILEKDVIYLTEVPDNFVRITSGMGEALPSCIVIVPLMLNEDVYGAIELCFFNSIPAYKVDFLRKLTENMASTIGSMRTTFRTQRLLEESQKLAMELQEQEETLRQNMEELTTTQEELRQRELRQQSLIEELNTSNEKMKIKSVNFRNKMEELDIENEAKNAQIATLDERIKELETALLQVKSSNGHAKVVAA